MDFRDKKVSSGSKFDLKNTLIILVFAVLSAVMIRVCLVKLFPEDGIELINKQRIVLKDEVVEVEEDGKTALEIAGYFCLREGYNVDQPLFLNVDEDEDSEVAGVCWEGDNYDKEGLLFILDRQEGEYSAIVEKEGSVEHQREKNFENLDTVDVDEDGIDEIIYGERGWWISGSDLYIYLYSSKYEEWFHRVDHKRTEIVDGETITSEQTEYSENLEGNSYLEIRNFLESHYVSEDDGKIALIEEAQEDEEEIDSQEVFKIVESFCEQEEYFGVERISFLNADEDDEQEVAGTCLSKENREERLLFILDGLNGEYDIFMEKKSKPDGNFTVRDVDNDGIDELLYGENDSSIFESEMLGMVSYGDFYLYLYSPKYNEWFYSLDKRDFEIVDNEIVTSDKIEYSDNLADGAYSEIKTFLASRFATEDDD